MSATRAWRRAIEAGDQAEGVSGPAANSGASTLPGASVTAIAVCGQLPPSAWWIAMDAPQFLAAAASPQQDFRTGAEQAGSQTEASEVADSTKSATSTATAFRKRNAIATF